MNYYSRTNGSIGNVFLAFIGGAVAWALFGPKIKQRREQNEDWQNLKREVEGRASQVKGITQEKYNQIVDEASRTYAKARGISQHEMADLVSDLKMHWNRIKTAWRNDQTKPPMQMGSGPDEGANNNPTDDSFNAFK